MKPARNRVFDLLRLLLATLVLLAHAPEMTDGTRTRELLSRLTHGAMSFGELGVDGFFLLSGFLITQSWVRDPRLGDYLQKRVLRIVPGYLVAVLLSILVVGLLAPAVPHFFRWPGRKALQSVLLLSSPLTQPVYAGEPYPIVNGALWTIAYEFRCYLLVAAAGLAGLLARRWLVPVCAALLLLLANAPGLAQHVSIHAFNILIGEPMPTFRMTAFFATGCCYFLFRDRVAYRPLLLFGSLAGLALVHVFAVQFSEASLCVFGSYALFYVAQMRIAALDAMQGLPDISYGVYLYGWPVEHLWYHFAHGSPWVLFAGSTAICLVLGWLSWHLVERPFLRMKRRPSVPLPAG